MSSIVLLSGCLVNPYSQKTKNDDARIDEVPMYGGIDRSKYPKLKAGDEKFIADVSKAFGSREQAADKWVNQGYRFYNNNQLGMAMRRFNQAWLLDPKNAEIYAGYGGVLSDQKKHCDAAKMMAKALTLNPPTFQGIYTDAARLFARCAITPNNINKETLIAGSEGLYKKADEIEPDKRYIYSSWATSYYQRGAYKEAWRMVAKARAEGRGNGAVEGLPSGAANKPSESFLNALRAKMSEPKLPL